MDSLLIVIVALQLACLVYTFKILWDVLDL